MSTFDTTITVEYAHETLPNLLNDDYTLPDLAPVHETLDAITDHGYHAQALIVVDDTGTDLTEMAYTDADIADAVDAYIADTGIDPDITAVESAFGDTVDALLDEIPQIDDPGALGKTDTWGCYTQDEKTYVYGSNDPGTSKPKVKLVDTTTASRKRFPYTCQAYDTAITLEKLGITDHVDALLGSDAAITFHAPYGNGSSFDGSPPQQASHQFQNILSETDIIPYDPDESSGHVELDLADTSPKTAYETVSELAGDLA